MKPLNQAKQDFVRDYLKALLRKVHGRTGRAAEIAGWTVPNFCQLLRRHGIRAGRFR